MLATRILMEEHALIERVLDTLEKGAQQFVQQKPVPSGFFLDVVDFIRNFADRCHHGKEEGVLFKAMVEHGFPENQGPIAVMLFEHEQGRGFTQAMSDATQRLEAGDKAAREEIVANALAYVSLLRQHIQKENNVLFRMADNVIPPSGHDEIDAAFARVEREDSGRGLRKKYEALAQALGDQLESLSYSMASGA
jgi:hemerythrin-like domain-containing protein